MVPEALVELVASEALALRAVLVVVAGDAGRLATGKLAEVAVLKFVVALALRSVLRRAAPEHKLAGCTELLAALARELLAALVGLVVLGV